MFDFSELPVIDNHSHPYLFETDGVRYEPLDSFLGLPGDRSPAALAHRDAMLYQRWATRELAAFLGCAATPAAVAAARHAVGDEADFVRRLFADERIEAILVDTGFPQPPVDMAQFRDRVPTQILTVYRIEPPIKALLDERVGYDEFVRRFDDGLRRAIRDEGFVAVKSIIAYRTGLDIDPANASDEAGRAGLERALAEPERMMASKTLRDHIFLRTLTLCGELGVSFHIHTGIGDADIVLARCSPALLNETLKQPEYGDTKVVLIHTYPYMAEASWMAGALPNLWIDLSEGVPFALAAVDRIFETALELAPVNRVLFGTDAFSGPEQTWLGAKVAKQALARVLTKLCERGYVVEAEAPDIAAAILAGNARAMYDVRG
ncbi:MAG TPA: amidohydrolase family protein [Thermomicrobiales bacterium]|nr:amidohydrolase family protein [Thermomicrobiales bacterium]